LALGVLSHFSPKEIAMANRTRIAAFTFALLLLATLIILPTTIGNAGNGSLSDISPKYDPADPPAGTQSALFEGSSTVNPFGVQGQVVAWLRLRTGPGLKYPALGKVRYNTYVAIIGRTPDGYWLKIQVGNTTGWVYKPYVRYLGGGPFDVPVITDPAHY
jgi:hypothetical protein